MGNWEVDLSLIAPWLKEQDKETIIGVTVALNELRDVGPGLKAACGHGERFVVQEHERA